VRPVRPAGPLVCCVLPAVMVALGAGAALAGLVTAVPQLVWLSEHKPLVFGLAGTMLAISGAMLWRARGISLPGRSGIGAHLLAPAAPERWTLVGGGDRDGPGGRVRVRAAEAVGDTHRRAGGVSGPLARRPRAPASLPCGRCVGHLSRPRPWMRCSRRERILVRRSY
jgi:hypothetical protein